MIDLRNMDVVEKAIINPFLPIINAFLSLLSFKWYEYIAIIVIILMYMVIDNKLKIIITLMPIILINVCAYIYIPLIPFIAINKND